MWSHERKEIRDAIGLRLTIFGDPGLTAYKIGNVDSIDEYD